jgi:thioesterase domain-containing protein
VHPIGSGVLCYRGLAERLGAERPVYGLEARGFAGGQDPFTSVPDMAAAYAEAIAEAQPEGPYLLGGWSMGALVALEIARTLEARGGRVALIAAIDGATPGRVPRHNRLSVLAWFMRDLISAAGQRAALPMDQVSTLPPGERLRALFDWARSAGHLSADTTLAEIERLQRIFLAHQVAMEDYVPGATRAPVLLLDAADQPDRLRARAWAQWTPRLTRRDVPGDHYSVVAPSNLDALSASLGPALSAADGDAWRAA